MTLVTVATGVAFGSPIMFTIDVDADVVCADGFLGDVFEACNRIDGLGIDLRRLDRRWQQEFRSLIDSHAMASMSVGDTVSVAIAGGLRQRVFRVKPVGWSVVDISFEGHQLGDPVPVSGPISLEVSP